MISHIHSMIINCSLVVDWHSTPYSAIEQIITLYTFGFRWIGICLSESTPVISFHRSHGIFTFACTTLLLCNWDPKQLKEFAFTTGRSLLLTWMVEVLGLVFRYSFFLILRCKSNWLRSLFPVWIQWSSSSLMVNCELDIVSMEQGPGRAQGCRSYIMVSMMRMSNSGNNTKPWYTPYFTRKLSERLEVHNTWLLV